MGATSAALVCFALNSLLCRIALRSGSIDAATFAAVRFGSGAAALVLLVLVSGGAALGGSWAAAATLVVYAIPFSLAYLQLAAGTGALILSGSVQASMIGWGLWRREHPRPGEWFGLTLSLAGLVVLVLPSLSAPPPGSAALMAIAGIAWAAYSLQGRGTYDPLAAPSGAICSGIGYAVWYAPLRGLTRTREAIVQFATPAIAALGGVLLLGETVSLRLVVSGAVIFGGVGLALLAGR